MVPYHLPRQTGGFATGRERWERSFQLRSYAAPPWPGGSSLEPAGAIALMKHRRLMRTMYGLAQDSWQL
jgi:hypothetical protein